MKLPRLRSAVRNLQGRSFLNADLEYLYSTESRLAGVRTGYIFSWMAALSFVVFSVVEYFTLNRGTEDMVQRHRAATILFFSAIGVHAKIRPRQYEGIYEWVVAILLLIYGSAILYFESNTQMTGHPEFFYLSVTSTCILLTIAAYYFMRLPLRFATIVSGLLATITLYSVYSSGAFNLTVAGRMLTYIGVSNAVGVWIWVMFDLRERKIFLQNHRIKSVSALRKRMMLAELAANQAKTKLIAMLSHEIRTPMNTVARLIGLIHRDLEGNLSEKRLVVFQQIERACEHLLATLDDLLHYSSAGDRLAANAPPQPFLLEYLIAECRDLVSLSAHEKGLSLVVHSDGVRPDFLLLGQPHHLKRVLLNLLGNAIKFTDRGTITVRASLQEDGKDNALLVISVTDTGIGIPAKELANIFQFFYQVDSSYARRFGGTGLGLAISHRLIESMGGRILVDSAIGLGTTFTVHLTLPRACSAADSSKFQHGD